MQQGAIVSAVRAAIVLQANADRCTPAIQLEDRWAALAFPVDVYAEHDRAVLRDHLVEPPRARAARRARRAH